MKLTSISKNIKALVSILIGLVFSITSCRKYTCHCETILGPSNSTPAGLNKGGETGFIIRGTKTKAKKECESHSTQPDVNGDRTICEIK